MFLSTAILNVMRRRRKCFWVVPLLMGCVAGEFFLSSDISDGVRRRRTFFLGHSGCRRPFGPKYSIHIPLRAEIQPSDPPSGRNIAFSPSGRNTAFRSPQFFQNFYGYEHRDTSKTSDKINPHPFQKKHFITTSSRCKIWILVKRFQNFHCYEHTTSQTSNNWTKCFTFWVLLLGFFFWVGVFPRANARVPTLKSQNPKLKNHVLGFGFQERMCEFKIQNCDTEIFGVFQIFFFFFVRLKFRI